MRAKPRSYSPMIKFPSDELFIVRLGPLFVSPGSKVTVNGM